MNRLYIALLVSSALIYACGTTATLPASDGKIGVIPQTITQTPISTPEIIHDNLGVVVVDSLTVRVCPAQECQVAYKDGKEWYLLRGEAVMGNCYTFQDGSIWLEISGRYAAVVFEGERYINGVCQ